MEFKHKPVMLMPCIDGLEIKKDGIYVDGTLFVDTSISPIVFWVWLEGESLVDISHPLDDLAE